MGPEREAEEEVTRAAERDDEEERRMPVAIEKLREYEEAGLVLSEGAREKLRAAAQFEEEAEARAEAERAEVAKLFAASVRRRERTQKKAFESTLAAVDDTEEARDAVAEHEALFRRARRLGLDVQRVEDIAIALTRADAYELRKSFQRAAAIMPVDY